jgi:hypothetical protein
LWWWVDADDGCREREEVVGASLSLLLFLRFSLGNPTRLATQGRAWDHAAGSGRGWRARGTGPETARRVKGGASLEEVSVCSFELRSSRAGPRVAANRLSLIGYRQRDYDLEGASVPRRPHSYGSRAAPRESDKASASLASWRRRLSPSLIHLTSSTSNRLAGTRARCRCRCRRRR